MTDEEDPRDPGGTVIQLERPREAATRDDEPDDPEAGGEPAASDEADADAEPIPVVHPRLLRRRQAVEDEVAHRRIVRRIWVLGGLALVVDGLALAHTPLLDVERVVTQGTEHVPAETIAWASGIDRGDSLVTLDEGGAEDRLRRLPWVADADVVREWNGTVRIAVSERQPAAVVQSRPELPPAIVDAEGRVLDIAGPVPLGLVLVTGVGDGLAEGDNVPARSRDALRIALDAGRRAPGAVASVSTDLVATLAGGGEVLFGSADDLEQKMIALATVLADVDMSNVKRLDLRVPDRPALTRH